jgi:hypothetical protein
MFLALTALGAGTLAFAQGGGGGFGGGAQGGAAGGGTGGPGDVTSATHILSPGDTATWPLKAKEGEVVIVRVESDVFDPAVEMVDANKKVLGTNDDIRPGEQDALLLTRLPSAGDYTVQVKAYKGGSGGQYHISFTRFVPEDAKLSMRNSGTAGKEVYKWLRFPATKGQSFSFSAMSSMGNISAQLFNPAGLEQETTSLGGNQSVREAFRAEMTGDHYLRLGGQTGFSYSAAISPARTAAIAVGASETRKLEVGGLDIWSFDAKAGDLLRIVGTPKGAPVATMIMAAAAESGETETMETEEPYVTITSANKSTSDDTILVRRDGRFEVRVFQPLSLASDYELSIKSVTAKVDGEASGTLKVGVTDLYAFEAKAGEVVDLGLAATDFDGTLVLYDPNGKMISSNDDGAGDMDARLVVSLSEAGRYLVGVGSYGKGGGGAYKVTRAQAKIRPLAKGAKGESTLGSGTADIWSFTGKIGQTLVISAQSEEMDVDFVILAPDGTPVGSGTDEMGTNALASLVLPLDGTYTIWVRGSGSGKYTIRWLDLND